MSRQNLGTILDTPQAITGDWVDVGSPIETIDFSFFRSFIDLTIGDSQNIQFRYLLSYQSGSSEYPEQAITVNPTKTKIDPEIIEVNTDASQLIALPILTLMGTVAFVQLQVKALTVGSSAGTINSAYYRQYYQQ